MAKSGVNLTHDTRAALRRSLPRAQSRGSGQATHETLHRDLFREAKRYLVGGVNSPVRSFKAVGGSPLFVKSGEGAKIYSEGGREFIDYCLSWGALILGHSHKKVTQEIKRAAAGGTSFGAPTKQETELAKIITAAIPSIEKLRLVNSGTEAVMSAIRLARAYTKKNKIIKFAGSYHGHADYLLDSLGVPKDFKSHTLVAAYNDVRGVEKLVYKYKKDLAAIIVEPIAGNMGVVLPKTSFLAGLRALCDKYAIALIFDEVITGFRVAFGAAQTVYNIKPDLTCLGKIIGGGLPIGAVGGRKEIMDLLAPEGGVYQAGTFSGNPVSVSAGLATLKILSEENPYKDLERLTRQLCVGIRQILNERGFKARVNFMGSMFSIFFVNREVTDYNIARTQDARLFKRFYHALLNKGVYFSPSGLEANFLSAAHTERDIENTLRLINIGL